MFDNEIIKYENEYIKNNIKNYKKIQHIYTKININANTNTNTNNSLEPIIIHSLFIDNKTNRNLVLVHGTGGSCMSYVNILNDLLKFGQGNSQASNIYIIDLPGFGRSHINNTNNYKSFINSDFYVHILDLYLKALHLNNIILCGHSFGAYVCTKYVGSRSKENAENNIVSKLILISPAGIFPTMGSYGFYWAVFFKFTAIRYFEIFFYFIISKLIKYYVNMCSAGTNHSNNLICDTPTYSKQLNNMYKTLYWLYLLSHPKSIGSLIVSNNIELSKDGGYWNDPTFDYLKMIKCPILLVYGSDDTIVPPQQGQVLNTLLGHELFVVPNTGHNPMESNLLTNRILEFINKSIVTTTTTFNYPKTINIKENKHNYKSTFDINQTNNVITKLYSDLGYINSGRNN